MNGEELHVWNVTETLLEARVVKIYGEINTKIAHEVTSLLDVLSNDDPSAVIKLEVCSPGGSVLDGLAIIDKIKQIPNPVVAFNTGLCASMGTAICASCDYAFGAENAQFMIHEVSSGTEGKFREMKNSMAFTESLNKRLMEILGKKCKKSPEEIMSDCVRDLWLTAEQAKEYGLIDEITPYATKDTKALDAFVKGLTSK